MNYTVTANLNESENYLMIWLSRNVNYFSWLVSTHEIAYSSESNHTTFIFETNVSLATSMLVVSSTYIHSSCWKFFAGVCNQHNVQLRLGLLSIDHRKKIQRFYFLIGDCLAVILHFVILSLSKLIDVCHIQLSLTSLYRFLQRVTHRTKLLALEIVDRLNAYWHLIWVRNEVEVQSQ